ncbi:MAG: hypothetical protein JRS35_18875 [Deltaproteobacteria bacterium]|nr:hypothetical protein [Deltaproteobacteria bacterium]
MRTYPNVPTSWESARDLMVGARYCSSIGRHGCIDTVRHIDRLDVATLQLGSLVKVARAVGVSPAELVPGLAARPLRPGLIDRRSAR